MDAAHFAPLTPGLYSTAQATARCLLTTARSTAPVLAPVHLPAPPQWHYYNTWMAQRIAEQHPALPQPVVSKLLAQDAGELDFRISHPEALADQVRAAPRGPPYFCCKPVRGAAGFKPASRAHMTVA